MSIKIALAGNPNCGKTTLFNALTGSNQFVGEVVEISALKGTGIMKAAEKAISAAQSKKKTIPVHEFAQDVEDAIKSVENKLTGTVAEAQKRFFAIKLIEKDDKIVEQMKSVPDVSYEVKALEDKFDDDTESIITNERYVYISSIIGQCYTKSSTGNLQPPIRSTES